MYNDNSAPGLSVATALFFTWAILTFCVRAWVKLRRSEGWGWDDSTISAALAFALAHVITIFYAIAHGYGTAFADLPDSKRTRGFKALYSSEFFYIISIGMTKVSVALFIGQLTRRGPQIKIAYVLSAVCGVWTIASLFVVGLRGDLKRPWKSLNGSNTMFVRWTIVEVTGLVVELALWGLSVHIIWNLSMALSKRCTVLAIFGFRLLLIPLVAVRLYWLSPSRNAHQEMPNNTADVLTEAVLEFAFISASVTCLKPFLKPFASSFVVNSMINSGSGYRTGSHVNSKDPYYSLSAVQSEHDGAVLSDQDPQTNLSASRPKAKTHKSFRPDEFDQEVTVTSSSRQSSSNDVPDPMTIRKTESWSVRFEEGKPVPVAEKPRAGQAPPTVLE